jgi:hypothetical protein
LRPRLIEKLAYRGVRLDWGLLHFESVAPR